MADPNNGLPPGFTIRPPGGGVAPGPAGPAQAPGGGDLPPGFSLRQPSSGERTSPPAPVTPAAAPVKNRQWDTDLAAEALENLPGSVADEVGGMVDAIGKTITTKEGAIETAKNIAKLAATVPAEVLGRAGLPIPNWRKVAADITPFLGPETAAKVNELVADLYKPQDAIVKDYTDAYGTDEARKKTIAERPARVLMDLATVLTGGEGALLKAPQVLKLSGTAANVVSKTGKVMGTAANILDPVSGALSVATKVAPKLSDLMTGSGSGVMQEAGRTGYVGGEAGREFRTGLAGETDPRLFVDKAKGGLDTMKQKLYADFAADKDVWDKVNGRLNFNEFQNAQQNITKGMYSQTGNTTKRIVPAEVETKVNDLFNIVEQWRRDPAAHTVLGFDDLKKALRNSVDWRNDHTVIKQAATELANTAQKEVIKAAKGTPYEKSMKAYGEGMDTVHEIEDAFSLGDKAKTQTGMSKLQSVFRNNASTQYGLRKNLMETLRDESGVDLFPELAGHAASSWRARGMTGPGLSASLPGLGAYIAGTGGFPALGVAGLGLAGSSPKLMAGLYHNIGRAAGLPGQLAGKVAGPYGRFAVESLASQPAQTAYRNLNTINQDQEQQGRRRGGRVGYADGGEVLLQPRLVPAMIPLPIGRGQASLGLNYDPTSRYGSLEGGYEHPVGRYTTLGLQGHIGKDLGPEGASARPDWGIGLRGRVRFADGGDVGLDELPPPAAMRGANSYFMPSVSLQRSQRTPSMAVLPPQPEMAKLPDLGNLKPTNEWGGLLDKGIGLIKERQDAKEKIEKDKAYEDLLTRLKAQGAAAPTTADTSAPEGGRNVVQYDQTLGLPEATPIPGDSYEAKVRGGESGGNDAAVNKTTGAAGRFQFMPSTAEGIRQQHPELKISDNWRTNADDQMKLMKVYTDTSREILRKQLGREPTGGELYALHLFGHGGGPRVLGGLDRPITEITTEAERNANPFLKSFATGKDLLNYFNRRFG